MENPEYKIAYSDSIEALVIEVNEFIEDGFMPIGSLQVLHHAHAEDGYSASYWEYHQAMIKIPATINR